jgi:hypothetical protein
MDPEEREVELKTVKMIELMPAKVQDRFKALYILSDQRSKMNDAFSQEL